ncbi:hypothetical protein FUAX_43500 (plasmid) [Fulvitalea axinellae]|uniref:Uncharacterized protein n=1 Tax=Fulvitalea axinellae TaxID=1182444 RepID=A0AAU9D7D2_9BACT|nr:hypothetical protein FUAX_43500 [Fulvitalea axinellae]
MDSALRLKFRILDNSVSSFKEARPYLDSSELFQRLLTDFEETSLSLLHRLIQLSEIPFSQGYKSVQEWRDKLADTTFCGSGFSLTGKEDDLLACYNAMISTVLIRLGYQDAERINQGVSWILNYQNTERGLANNWSGKGIRKYGGCMKSTPCFIGVVKSMITLTEFVKTGLGDEPLKSKLKGGLEYILEHRVFMRKHTGGPITKDIIKLTYPFTYKTNILEILRLLDDNDLVFDKRAEEAKALLLKKRRKDGSWRQNAFYKPKHWIDFDNSNEKAEWLNFEIEKVLRVSG